MEIPPAFNQLSNSFHQDWDIVFGTLDHAIAESVRVLSKDEKVIAKEFLDRLLSANYSDDELARMWNTKTLGGAGGFCIESGASWFLGKLKTELIESLKKS